ncbi:MAG: transporter substrate-binding domain-containing protein [Ruminococcaceae bacterium]|nr:transporter substrate-binding domain-containing protein [Oscillospiraceae bacterium]
MKRTITTILSVMLIVATLFTFVACDGDKKDENNNKFGKELLGVTSQLDALNGLKKGDADIAVIDSVMAGYYMNSTEEFKDYQVLDKVALAEEKYGIAAKKGNEALMSKINEALIALVDSDYKTVAATYGLTTELLVKADTTNPYANATDKSWDDVAAAKKLIVGYTLFAPIAYNDGEGADAKLVGFDIDLAKAVVKYLNTTYSTEVEIEFIVIDWNQKEALLENGSIDLVWNGMTITPEREAGMCVSVPYLANKQVAIASKTDAEKYNKAYDEFVTLTADAVIIVEKGSAGESQVLPDEEK